MKRIACFFSMWVLSATISSATVRTVCNMAYSPGQFMTFDAAIAASVSNDTIYVHGSSFSYGITTIGIPLVIIGAGHHPNKQSALPTTFDQMYLNTSGCQLIGLTINYLFGGQSQNTVKRCRLTGSANPVSVDINDGTGWLIEGNVFDNPANFSAIDFHFSRAQNLIIQNNIFSSNGTHIENINNTGADHSYILNNIFIGSLNVSFTSITFTSFENNIFYGSSPAGSISNSTENNNISFNTTNDTFTQPGLNNLTSVDPKFVSYPGGLFSYLFDFSLAPGSPGLANGTDGTDRGVFGGLGSKFTMTGEPAIAEITLFTITSPTTIAPGGTLDISVTSKRVH